MPVALAAGAVLAACSEAPPTRTFDYYMANELALESTLVRCNADRMRTRGDPDCINARIAVERLAKMEEEAVRQRQKAEALRARAAKLRQERLEQERLRGARESRSEPAYREDNYAEDPYAGTYSYLDSGSAPSAQTAGSGPDPGDGSDMSQMPGAGEGAGPGNEGLTPPASKPIEADEVRAEIRRLEEELRRRREANQQAPEDDESGA